MVLNSMFKTKEYFDVKNKSHVATYKKFLQTYTWGQNCCPFELEEPYLSVPDMIKDKLVHYYLKVEL